MIAFNKLYMTSKARHRWLITGDEVIMPTHTFVPATNIFALGGSIPKLADTRPDTLNNIKQR